MKEILQFLKELRENNNREWFNQNKDRYKEVRRKVENLASELITGLSAIEPEAAKMMPSDCLYRIYRDTRFSNDKTPYKQHIGIYINPFGGKKSQLCGYYLHIEPGNSFVGGGLWCPPTQILKAVRQSIYDNIEEYLEIIENPEFKAFYPVVGEDFLKTAPKSFDKNWEHIDLLKPKCFTVMSTISDRTLCSKDGMKKVIEGFRVQKPFNDFINFIFEEDKSLPRFF